MHKNCKKPRVVTIKEYVSHGHQNRSACCVNYNVLGMDDVSTTIIIIIIKLYFDTIKSGTYVPFTGVYIHVNR